MHEIYRLEYENGKGVYWAAPPEVYYDLLYLPHHQEDQEDHPRPEDDGMGRSAWAGMIFGFQSLQDLRAWFCGAERLYLSSWGVLCSKYFARGPIIAGKKQVAFYRNSATLLWQKELNHF